MIETRRASKVSREALESEEIVKRHLVHLLNIFLESFLAKELDSGKEDMGIRQWVTLVNLLIIKVA
jgi:hypothetical protein